MFRPTGCADEKILLRSGGYAVRCGLVHVLDVGDVFVDDDVVVVVVYDGVVHRRVRDVDVCNVSATYVIRGARRLHAAQAETRPRRLHRLLRFLR